MAMQKQDYEQYGEDYAAAKEQLGQAVRGLQIHQEMALVMRHMLDAKPGDKTTEIIKTSVVSHIQAEACDSKASKVFTKEFPEFKQFVKTKLSESAEPRLGFLDWTVQYVA
jgi:hypothetical protein